VKSFAWEACGELIGRAREAAALSEHRREASEGRGRVVLVAGEAGVGKSRLLRHFESAIAGTRSICSLARCVEFVQTPLSPLRDLLMQLDVRSSAEEGGPATELIERLAFERYIEPEKQSLPVGSLFDSIEKVFARYALRRTTVLLIEDLHWADRSTIMFLAYLADRIRRRRLLVVATYRAEEMVATHPRLADIAMLLGKECVAPLEMAPLDERSSRMLAAAILPRNNALDAPTLADIVRRTQGNPFFIEELIKAALVRDAAGGIKRLPLSVRGAVLARAAMLSPTEREILSMAAVLGERFSIERLVSLLGGDRDEVLKALERARELQIVYDRPNAPGAIAFRHALTQEVLYDELLAERVRPLHETIARELEQRSDPSAVSVELAHHWLRAGNLARAARYAEIAGDRAAAIGAMADAIQYYERALADGDSETSAAGLLHKLGLALGSLNELGPGIERLRLAGDRYWRLGDLEGFAENASALGTQLYNSGDPAAGTQVFREAIGALEPKLPAAKLDILRARIAYNCVAALDFDAALSFLSDVREPIADARTATHFYQTRFKVAAMRGKIQEWRLDSERALQAARRLNDGGLRLRHTHCQIALDAVGFGETNLARQHFQAALHSESEHGEPKQSLAAAASAIEHTLRGDFSAASRLLEEGAGASQQSVAIHIHVKSARLVLGICTGDVALLRRDDVEPFLHYGLSHGMNLALGLLGGPYAWALGVRGELEEAAVWIARMATVLPCAHRFLFAYLAAAQFGKSEDVLAMRRKLEEAAGHPQDRADKAALSLFDAFAARRGIVTADVPKRALEAGSAFEAIGWPWLAALGYELGGESGRARDIYRTIGALRDLRRVEMGRPDATAAILSPREREVADLAASGHSNDEIARMLHISLRTVEKHVSSALRKLNIRSRVQLGLLLARS
jgi:DNA-binding CsgD family transcriptional regulator